MSNTAKSNVRYETVAQTLAELCQAIHNCGEKSRTEWLMKHTDSAARIVADYLPHGSGFDSGTTLDFAKSHADKLVFHTSYHHMNDGGYYDGWTEHTVTVTPGFSGFNLKISGVNRNDIKDYIHEVFAFALGENCIVWDYASQNKVRGMDAREYARMDKTAIEPEYAI